MITTSNTDEIARQLEEFSKEVDRKLQNMVAGFAMEVAISASDNTPIGSADMYIDKSRYRNYYLYRQQEYGLPIEPGYHRGAWQYTESGNAVFVPNIYSTNEMQNDVYSEAHMSYKLGDSFSIAATGPGFEQLQAGSSWQALQGIGAPTITQVMTIHEAKLKQYYDAG